MNKAMKFGLEVFNAGKALFVSTKFIYETVKKVKSYITLFS